MPLTIRKITSLSDKKRFIRFLWDVYRGDPNWVAPLMMDRLKLMDEKKNPFYHHADSAFFLAEDNGKVVGRIAAIVNHNYTSLHQEQSGHFGFFECIDDVSVAKQLFEAAEGFLRERGMTKVYGPASPSSNDEMGLLIDGFDRPPVMLMTYNPPYYEKLIEACGYGKAMDLYAYILSQKTSRTPKLERVVRAMQERSHVKVRSFDPKNFDRDVALVKYLFNEAWERNWQFVPFTDPEIDFLAKDLKQVYDPELVLFAETQEGETIGFALSLPDVNQAFHAGPKIPKGPLNLLVGLYNLFTKKKKIDTVRVLVLGVLPTYRNRGIDALLYWETMERAQKKGFNFGEASWVLENNEPMNRAAKMLGGERYKTYRVYEKQLK